MTIFDILTLISGLALFLYGMDVMAKGLKKSAGKRLREILSGLTSSPIKGFLLGLGVTAVIQSSSAMTVMVVGFVNSGTMLLSQAITVIMGANVGTTITAWLTGLSGVGDGGTVTGILNYLKPSAWMPVLALIGIILIMFSKKERRRDIGVILMGFAVLMVGMDVMSDAVEGLEKSETFRSVLTTFENPLLGLLAGVAITAILQSSSASIGILQSLSTTGAITYGAAMPIILGQNIGTCITALLSALGAGKSGKRAALVQLYFNVIGALVFMGGFFALDALIEFAFMESAIDMWGIAAIHTIFNLVAVLLLAPFRGMIEKLAVLSVKGGTEEIDPYPALLDERFLDTPDVAVERAHDFAHHMMEVSVGAIKDAIGLLADYSEARAQGIRDAEEKVDTYEDLLGAYLISLSSGDPTREQSEEVTKLLHLIGDFERISDHAVNLVEAAEEIRDKNVSFSDEAKKELAVLMAAVTEILTIAETAYLRDDLHAASHVEPLEEVVDDLKDIVRTHHIRRLQAGKCTTEHGFILSDILTNLERVSDHCSNIAVCLMEIAEDDTLGMHGYAARLKAGSAEFEAHYREYKRIYRIEETEVGV